MSDTSESRNSTDNDGMKGTIFDSTQKNNVGGAGNNAGSQGSTTSVFMAKTINMAIEAATEEAIKLGEQYPLPLPKDVIGQMEDIVLNTVNIWIQSQNMQGDKNVTKIPRMNYLKPISIAMFMIRFDNVKKLKRSEAASRMKCQLAIYQTDGPAKGIYTTDEAIFSGVIRKYHFSIRKSEITEVLAALNEMAPIVDVGKEKELIAVNNGIFDYEKRILLEFSPEYVFVSKCPVNFVDSPINPTIHNDSDGTDWDIETWMHELTDDPHVKDLLWQVVGAVIRPNVRWDKTIMLYSTAGNNGKGTFCTLLRNICGNGNHASISIQDTAKDFMLASLLEVSAVIADENNTSGYLDDAKNFKAMVTGDILQINRKHRDPVDFRFSGLMVQCINYLPRVIDKTSSFYRRLLMVPFEKCFTNVERKYIKSNYLNRTDVLEYVLHKVLVELPSYYKFDIPAACEALLQEYREFNDPVRQFAEEIVPQLKWDLVPFKFLYDLYKEWYKESVPSGKVQGKTSFTGELRDVLADNPEWEIKNTSVPTQSYSFDYEPLIAQYNLKNWMNSMSGSTDKMRLCTPLRGDTIKSSTCGILRVRPCGAVIVNPFSS